jgi:hypothetical protein
MTIKSASSMVLSFFVDPAEGNEVIAGAIKEGTTLLSEYGPRLAEDGRFTP